jgi:hypothetical protein
MPRPIALFVSLALGAGCAMLISCGGDGGGGGIPAGDATGMLDELDRAELALSEGNCTEVVESAQQIQANAENSVTDTEVRTALVEGSSNLAQLATTQCEEQTTTEEEPETTTEEEPETTTEETEPPTTTTTEEETTTTTTAPEEEGDEEGEEGPPGQPPGPPEDSGPTGGTGDGKGAKGDKKPKKEKHGHGDKD